MPINKIMIEGYEVTQLKIKDLNDETQSITIAQVPQEYTNSELAINALHNLTLEIKNTLNLTDEEIKKLFLRLHP